MSYCRFSGESDVYLYASVGRLVCCSCLLNTNDDSWLYSPREALEHLKTHRKAGHKVPKWALDRLKRERGQ